MRREMVWNEYPPGMSPGEKTHANPTCICTCGVSMYKNEASSPVSRSIESS